MKTLKLLFLTLITGILLSSCVDRNVISLEEVVSGYDLWYVDYNRTEGNGDVPFLSKAFTISFINGNLYANNNLVGIGATGNGYGIRVGYYDTYNGILEIDHSLDGYFDFEVVQLAGDMMASQNIAILAAMDELAALKLVAGDKVMTVLKNLKRETKEIIISACFGVIGILLGSVTPYLSSFLKVPLVICLVFIQFNRVK